MIMNYFLILKYQYIKFIYFYFANNLQVIFKNYIPPPKTYTGRFINFKASATNTRIGIFPIFFISMP